MLFSLNLSSQSQMRMSNQNCISNRPGFFILNWIVQRWSIANSRCNTSLVASLKASKPTSSSFGAKTTQKSLSYVGQPWQGWWYGCHRRRYFPTATGEHYAQFSQRFLPAKPPLSNPHLQFQFLTNIRPSWRSWPVDPQDDYSKSNLLTALMHHLSAIREDICWQGESFWICRHYFLNHFHLLWRRWLARWLLSNANLPTPFVLRELDRQNHYFGLEFTAIVSICFNSRRLLAKFILGHLFDVLMSLCVCPNPCYFAERSPNKHFPHVFAMDNHLPSNSLPIPSHSQTTFNIPAHDIFNFGSSPPHTQEDESLSDAESFG